MENGNGNGNENGNGAAHGKSEGGKVEFVIVPGAWHGPDAFSDLTSILSSSGHKCHSITLPSVGADPPLSTFDPDVEAIRAVVKTITNAGGDAVLFMHSYGGVVGTEAVKEFVDVDGETGRGRGCGRGRVVRLIYCCAFVLPKGASLMIALKGEPLPWFEIKENNTIVTPSNPAQIFYNDLPPAQAQEHISRLHHHSYATFSSALTCEPWRHIPCSYFVCERDNAIPAPAQRGMIEAANAACAEREVFREEDVVVFDASHSPFLSMPEEVARAMIVAAG